VHAALQGTPLDDIAALDLIAVVDAAHLLSALASSCSTIWVSLHFTTARKASQER
jgi:hypothetical protein